jgi:hypothetical protein
LNKDPPRAGQAAAVENERAFYTLERFWFKRQLARARLKAENKRRSPLVITKALFVQGDDKAGGVFQQPAKRPPDLEKMTRPLEPRRVACLGGLILCPSPSRRNPCPIRGD